MTKETLEEAAESRYGTDMDSIRGSNVYDLNTDLKRGFIEGAKWQQERMYSEEDLREAFKGGSKMCWTDINQETQEPYYYDFNEWFEQFKKGGQDE
jgi:hypothetical protein